VEDHFEAFEGIYKERFEQRYGFFRPFFGFNPHLHVLISEGCFHESGMPACALHADRQAISESASIRAFCQDLPY
jgi:hypothetical protein